MTRRTERVNELLRQEISQVVREELRDPRIGGLVSITRVDVSPDLRRAHAWVSVLGSADERASTMRALQSARPFVRKQLARRLSLRVTPDVEFLDDVSLEKGQELTEMMRRTARERGEML
jgi:ribosome-binding factor A